MRKLIYLLIICVAGCNSQEESTTPAYNNKEQDMKSLMSKYPDSTLLVENLAQYYRDNDEYDKAIKIVDDGLKKDSSVPAYWHIKGVLHYENDDTIKAITALEKSTVLTKDLSDILLLAKLYAETKNFDAIKLSNALILQNVFVKEALYIKGSYFTSLGEYDKAIQFFDEAIAASYTFAEAYLEKSKILYEQGNYMEALRVADKAVKVKNNFAEGYYFMGRCFEKLDRKDDAIESYQTALIYDRAYKDASDALKLLK